VTHDGILLETLVKLRHEKALLMGFATHAEFVTAVRMSGGAAKVGGFLGELATKVGRSVGRPIVSGGGRSVGSSVRLSVASAGVGSIDARSEGEAAARVCLGVGGYSSSREGGAPAALLHGRTSLGFGPL
jgi:hypothetical protein